MPKDYRKTITACFAAYIVQAIIVNFAPLLFLTFNSSYGIPLTKITVLVSLNFGLQLTVDAASVGFIDKLGYRASMITAHILSAVGLISMAVLPELIDPFIGLTLSVSLYAVGGGLLEVLVSPVVEACPTSNKEKAMSLLHSFYCWGQVGVVLLSTVFFTVFGVGHWRVLAFIWAMVPAVTAAVFCVVPMPPPMPGGVGVAALKNLFSDKRFWVFMLIMLCAGASEQAVSQWASAFAERGLGISKTAGDLAGPMLFAVLMGATRAFYGKYGEKIRIDKFILISGAVCVASYFIASLSPFPLLGLAGCALSGLGAGILWPGTLSSAAASIKGGGTAMFALFALAGDLGCSVGPALVGFVAGDAGDNLKLGLLAASVFPLVMIVAVAAGRRGTGNGGTPTFFKRK